MKILQIGKYSLKFAGGIEKTINLLSEYLAKEHDVTVVTNDKERKGKTYFYKNIFYEDLPTWNIFSTPITPKLISFLKGKEYDIIQISHPNPIATLAYLIAKPKGKLVVWYHYDIFRQRILKHLYNPILKYILKKASCIITTSDNYLQTSKVLKNYKSKTIAIPHGIKEDDFNNEKYKIKAEKIKQKFGKPLVLFVGRLIYYKGLKYLIEAMDKIDAKLLIIGQGPLEKELKSLVKELNIEEKVIFKKVPQKESLAKYYHACDVFVLPSIYRSEAFGIVLLEAMTCGKPIITTEIGTGTSFVCQNNINGLVVPPKNTFVLRKAIKKLITNKELTNKFEQAGKKRFEKYFTLDKMGESFERLYEEILNKKIYK
jgi:glycosyltransferase involved in cell wall biosynthesis